MKKLKISVHIPLYLENVSEKKRIKNFTKTCNGFLNLSSNTEVFVHSNKNMKSKNKKIKFIQYNFKNIHPFKLTWFCRKLMQKQKNNYDIFIYSEDDIFFFKKNLKYWLEYKDICMSNGYNLGFLRVEKNKKNKKLYSSDQISKSAYYINLFNKKYFVVDNPYCAFWIYDKKEFNKFVDTKWWKFNWSLRSKSGILHIREMSAWGWHGIRLNGIDMDRYLATVIPLKNNKINTNSFIRHLSDNYANSPKGKFGTFKVEEILNKDLKIFKPSSHLKKFITKMKSNFYSSVRINVKNFSKKNKLHPDLIK